MKIHRRQRSRQHSNDPLPDRKPALLVLEHNVVNQTNQEARYQYRGSEPSE